MRAIAVLVICVALGGCASAGDINAWQSTATAAREEVQRLRVDLAGVEDPAQRAALEAQIQVMERIAQRFEDAISNAEDSDDAMWATGETALAVAAGFFPPLLAFLPVVRTLRRQRSVIFKSVAAGGGPSDPDTAKAVLSSDAAAYAAFQKWKADNPVVTP